MAEMVVRIEVHISRVVRAIIVASDELSDLGN